MVNNRYKSSKYKSKKIEVDGITFDSKKEAKRYGELKLLERVGEISDLQMQVKYILIPSQYEITGFTKTGKEKKKCVERECAYIADFVYKDNKGNVCIEDTKGFKTKDYIIKRKLMLYVYGIRIIEV